MSDNHIVLFDGVCNLCNRLVMFIIRYDQQGKFKFVSLQSDFGKSILQKHNITVENNDTFVLVMSDVIYLKSTASLKLLKELGGIWKVFYIFILIPRPIRDFVYDKIAGSRYAVFGKRESCMVPSDNIKDRFLE